MKKLERVMGIEPTLAAWEAAVLPLNYTRTRLDDDAILRVFSRPWQSTQLVRQAALPDTRC